ncbi:MAG: helix-turn-helix transcriptional regulator [Clostridiales bacterium]|nr:helix-turn-helix transcriptional regulator [Clostridiales bacterium]
MKEKFNVKIIKDYLEQKGICKTNFCKKCHMSVTSYNKILENNHSISCVVLFKIARELKVGIVDLFE